jgi:hypothetical protein
VNKYDSYQMTYEGCHILNPGSFTGRSEDAHNMAEDERAACPTKIRIADEERVA